jgi:glycogen synthase
MKILLCSHGFSPDVGGIETVSLLLAQSWTRSGEDLRICTRSAGAPDDDLGLTVIRNPSKSEFAEQLAWADVILQNNISLPWVMPILRSRKPWVCANHTWPMDSKGHMDWRSQLKRGAALLAGEQLGVSQVQASKFLGKPTIVGNPYDDRFYTIGQDTTREGDLLFLGRLTDDKGIDLALKALAMVVKTRPATVLTIIGRGEERAALEALATELGITDRVRFLGAMFGAEQLSVMRAHQLCVVPSRACESFGIVALEAAACGCVIIASDCGGLPEAVGPSGEIFPVGDINRLAELILKLLQHPELQEPFRENAKSHLRQFTADAVATRYLEALKRVAKVTQSSPSRNP